MLVQSDARVDIIVLYGAGGVFCAGADLKALSETGAAGGAANPFEPVQLPLRAADDVADGGGSPLALPLPLRAHTSDLGPMGPTRLELTKPVIAAIAGHAVAGGLELACWADLRVAEEDATLGVFCRRFGVPLIDGGTGQ